jgi:hypothetical protein
MPDKAIPEEASQPCPRCERERLAATITPEYIAQIAAELSLSEKTAAAPAEYTRRLKICAACDALRQDVLCSWCGCYVVLRAKPKESYCPYPGNDKWAKQAVSEA